MKMKTAVDDLMDNVFAYPCISSKSWSVTCAMITALRPWPRTYGSDTPKSGSGWAGRYKPSRPERRAVGRGAPQLSIGILHKFFNRTFVFVKLHKDPIG